MANYPEILRIPESVKLPYGIWDEDSISDFGSDVTGYCHEGFRITCDATKEEIQGCISSLATTKAWLENTLELLKAEEDTEA